MTGIVLPLICNNHDVSTKSPEPSAMAGLKRGAPQNGDEWISSGPSKRQRTESTPPTAPIPPSRQDRLSRLEQLTVQLQQPTCPWRLKLWNVFKDCSRAGASFGLTWATNRMFAASDGERAAYEAVTMGTMAGNVISNLVSSLFDVAISGHRSSESEVCKPKLYQRVKLESQAHVDTLSLDVQAAIRAFDLYIESYVHVKSGDSSGNDPFLVLMSRRQGLLLSIPTQIINVSHQGRGGCDMQRARIDQAVETMVQQYPKNIHDTLQTFIGQARANCFLAVGSRAQIYLQGPPGTGKTRFVSELARALGLPYQIIRLEDRYGLFGTSDRGYLQDKKISDSKIVGEVAFGMIEARCLNPILFFDEAGLLFENPSFLGLFRELLDPDRRELTLAAFSNLKIDFSRAIIVLAGNEPLKDEALLSRLRQVPFGALSSQHKRNVLVAAIDNEMNNNEQLEPKIIADLREQMMGSIDAIMAKDQDCKVPGVRTAIEVTKDLVAFRRNAILNHRLLDDSRVEELIASAFEQRLRNFAAERGGQ